MTCSYNLLTSHNLNCFLRKSSLICIIFRCLLLANSFKILLANKVVPFVGLPLIADIRTSFIIYPMHWDILLENICLIGRPVLARLLPYYVLELMMVQRRRGMPGMVLRVVSMLGTCILFDLLVLGSTWGVDEVAMMGTRGPWRADVGLG